MKITFLGTGTSHGVPVAGCHCPVCLSENPRNKRYRSSVIYEKNGFTLLVDISPEFRLQAIRSGISKVDAILITHAHNDHIGGLDDIRIFSRDEAVPLYTREDVGREIKQRYSYIFNPLQKGGGVPDLLFHLFEYEKEFKLGPFSIFPLGILHGKLEISGFKIDNTAYITDASHIPESTLEKLHNLDTLIINALRDRPHSTHQTVEDALKTIHYLKPKNSFLTHICHDLDHEELSSRLPENVSPAYDNQTLVFP